MQEPTKQSLTLNATFHGNEFGSSHPNRSFCLTYEGQGASEGPEVDTGTLKQMLLGSLETFLKRNPFATDWSASEVDPEDLASERLARQFAA